MGQGLESPRCLLAYILMSLEQGLASLLIGMERGVMSHGVAMVVRWEGVVIVKAQLNLLAHDVEMTSGIEKRSCRRLGREVGLFVRDIGIDSKGAIREEEFWGGELLSNAAPGYSTH